METMFPTRTSDGKVVVVEAATGQRFARWPVDVRELLERGGWTLAELTPDDAAVARATAASAPSVLAPVAPQVTPLGQPVIALGATPAVASTPTVTATRESRGGRR